MSTLISLLKKVNQLKKTKTVVALNSVSEITNAWMHFVQFKKHKSINILSLILLTKIKKVHSDSYMCFQEHGQPIDMKHL